MGGIGLDITVERIASDARRPMTLHRAIWRRVFSFIEKNLRYGSKPYVDILFYYMQDEAADRYHEGMWDAMQLEAEENRFDLSYCFMDGGGNCSVSYQAALHWLKLSLAALREPLDRIANRHGYRIVAPRDTLEQVLARAPNYPLVLLRDTVYAVTPDAKLREWQAKGWLDDADEQRIFSDVGVGATFPELTPPEQELVLSVAATGRCRCPMCGALRQ